MARSCRPNRLRLISQETVIVPAASYNTPFYYIALAFAAGQLRNGAFRPFVPLVKARL